MVKEVNKVRYYVARIGSLDHYYTLDLQWAAGVQDSKVLSRMVPPEPWFVWPLEVGRRWAYQGTFEDSAGKRQQKEAFVVVASEVVDVPAGRFSALKVVREADNGDSDEYWYAPEARFYVRWIGRHSNVQFDEQLREYYSARGVSPAPTPTPSKRH